MRQMIVRTYHTEESNRTRTMKENIDQSLYSLDFCALEVQFFIHFNLSLMSAGGQ